MDWRDSEASEDDANLQDDPRLMLRKRSSRACDQCRKTKSKCERGSGDKPQCKSCALAGTACTFLGPSYKRGPPKGYIHAIEQRWHQVESLLGAILQCPDFRVQAIVSELRQDDLAREILERVDLGPYGPSGRRCQLPGATKEDFFASILRSSETDNSRDPSRSRRQSRVSREIVSSSQDHGLSVVPSKEWQDNLSSRLAFLSAPSVKFGSYSGSNIPWDSTRHASQKRRLNESIGNVPTPPDWSSMYTIDPATDAAEFDETTEGLGQLSLDEHQEVRFHGQSSGLHLLSRNFRTDDRNEGGIWRLPMARVWPSAKIGIPSGPLDQENVKLPPLAVQDRLLELYFTYIHPIFPVVHKSCFLSEYQTRKTGETTGARMNSPMGSSFSSPRPEPTQEVTPLLLLSMFAVAARFGECDDPLPPKGKMWEGGCFYLDNARTILNKIFHHSRPSTVQALLLLGYREFGIGSMEQGWLFIGMAIRMAFDLGLNCDSTNWKIHGHDLFAPQETQTRRQIWWACCLADRYGSVYMGRPIMIKAGDFDQPLPNVDCVEDAYLWQPAVHTDSVPYSAVPGRVMSSFCATSRLIVIVGSIISEVYPVQSPNRGSKQAIVADLESRLDQWYITLPEQLQYQAVNKRQIPPPQILLLHIRYWGAVLLLHRAFIPNWKSSDETIRESTFAYRAFDLAQAAASHISAIVTVYRETFTLKRTSPFLTSYLFSAALMQHLTLTLRPSNIEASLGLERSMSALKEMEIVWPSAARAWELLKGVNLGPEISPSPPSKFPERNKRPAEDAFGQEKSSDLLQREAFGTPSNIFDQNTISGSGVQDTNTRLMAHMLGLEIPGIEASTSYYPGYEWWPRPNQPDLTMPASQSTSIGDPNLLLPLHTDDGSINRVQQADWVHASAPDLNGLNYAYDFQQFGV